MNCPAVGTRSGRAFLGALLASLVLQLTAGDAPVAARRESDPFCALPDRWSKPLPPGRPAPGTLRMIERLNRIRDQADPATMAFLSSRLAPLIEKAVATSTNLNEQVRLRFQLGSALTQAGRADAAVSVFEDIERFVASRGGRLGDRVRPDFRMRKATTFLRLGEQENCVVSHNAQSCLFPLQAPAVHRLPRGSQGALKLLEEQLREVPGDLGARWLLNIAHMTLGSYPDQAPSPWLIPPATFASEAPMPRFPEVAGALGVDVRDLAGGVIADDFDNDGFLDLMVSSWGLKGQLRFFHNDGDGHFTERTSEAGLVGLTSGLNIQQTDYNNDGLLDVWILRGA